MKIVIDNIIPFVHGLFEPYAEVRYINATDIKSGDLSDADALIIRTRTRCDSSLLEGTPVKMIATATSGVSHIDLKYCREHGIFVKNVEGATAGGVMNYVFSALYACAARKSIPLQGASFGIIGVGHTGSAVEKMARIMGFKVLLCDPYREAEEGGSQFCSLEYLLANSDIVSLHVPLDDSTKGMANEDFFRKMRLGAFFINTANGDNVVEQDLIDAAPKLGPIVIDVWSGEPDINLDLMEVADIATPHIAGYSYQSKQLGTMMAVRAVARFFSIRELYDFYPKADVSELEAVKLDIIGKTQGQIASAIQYNYPIFTDDFMFRMNPSDFAGLRTGYHYRREFFID